MVKLRAITKTVAIIAAISVFASASTVYSRSVNDGLGRTGFAWLKTFSDAGLSASGECFAARDDLAGILVHPAAIAGFNSSTYSQFVDLQGGTLRKSDSRDTIKPRMKGEARLSIRSALSDSSVDYFISMDGEIVPLSNLSLSVILPDSLLYIPGTSRIDGNNAPDPTVIGSTVIFRLGEVTGAWKKEIRIKTSIPVKGGIGELITKGLLTFNTPTEQNKLTPVVDNVLIVSSKEKRISQPDIILHPRFESFGADLDSISIAMFDSIVCELGKTQILHLFVIGHTDSIGIRQRSRHIFADNYALSKARAQSIGQYLAGKLNLTSSQVTVVGKGPDEPVASNSTPEGRALNRRVEIRFQIDKIVDERSIQIGKDRDSTWVEITGLRPEEKNVEQKEVTKEEKEVIPDYNKAVKMSYVSHYLDTQYGSIGYAGSFKGHDAAIRFTYVNYGEFNGRDINNESTGSFSAGDFGVTLNLGKKVRDDLKVGVMASFLSSKIEDFSSQAVSLDFGAIYEPPFEGLTVGAALMNVGTVIKGYSSSYKDILPTYLSVGARKKLAHAPVTLFTDVIFPNDNDIVYAYGVEISVSDILYINAGTKSRNNIDKEMQESSTDFFGRKSFGFGIDLMNYRFNYAFCPDDELEDIHKITLTAKLK